MTPPVWEVVAFILVIIVGVVAAGVAWMGLHRGDLLLMAIGGGITLICSVCAASIGSDWP